MRLFGNNEPIVNLKKNVFDLSEKTLFSSSAGQLLPLMCKETNPGEKFQINLNAITRSMPLNTAAFVRTRQYFHFFFVPYKHLWRHWDNFINGVDFRISSTQSSNLQDYSQVPMLDLKRFLREGIKNGYFFGTTNEYDNSFTRVDTDYDLGMLDSTGRPFEYSVFINDEDLFNKYKSKSLDSHGYLNAYGTSRLLDLLEYGFNVSGHPTLGSLVDKHFKVKNGGYNDSDVLPFIGSAPLRVNIFRALAYQKIYNDFYKRDDYEKSSPEYFNIDDVYTNLQLDSLPLNRLVEIFKLRYRWLPKDYFTGVVPHELYGADRNINSLISGVANYDFSFEDGTVNINNPFVEVGGAPSYSRISTAQIRSAFAVEKLMRLSRRAGGQDYISQTLAHYGFKVPEGRSDLVKFLGGFTNTIDISEVISNSNNAFDHEGDLVGNIAGQVFGKGVGVISNNQEIEFEAPEHGIIMCIGSIVPELDYSSEGLSRFNTKYLRGDYFHPEFQDLGYQPVYSYELKNELQKNSVSQKATALGYVPMYSEYKTSYDKLHGEFRNGRSLSAWSASQLVSVDDSSSSSGVKISSLRINPKCLDRIFAVNYNGSESTDQFITSVQFTVKSIRPMSVTGQQL